MLLRIARAGLLLVCFAALVAAVAIAPAVHAQAAPESKDDTARAYFKTGKAHFDVGEWEAALADFNESYRLSDRPELLFNIYSCYERLGNAAQAADYLDRYLSLAQVLEADREVLNRKLANLRQRAAVAEQTPATPAAAPVAPQPPATAEVSTSTASDGGLFWTWIVGGASVAALAGGGIMLALAAGEFGDLEDKCKSAEGCSQAEIDEKPGSGLATGSIVLFVAGGLLAAGAITLFVIESDDGETETRVGLLPGGLSVSGTF